MGEGTSTTLKLPFGNAKTWLPADGDADPELKALRKKLTEHRKARPNLVRTMIMRELPQPRVSYIHLGGDFTRKGATVKPGVLEYLHPLELGGRDPNRLDLARWLVDRRNPLTSRVPSTGCGSNTSAEDRRYGERLRPAGRQTDSS